MAIDIRQYADDEKRVWDRFVWKANNGTLFHTRQFLSYHPPDRFEDHSLMLEEDGRLLAVFPAALRSIEGKQILASHCGSSYGGLVYQEPTSIGMAFAMVEALLDYGQKKGLDRIEMTLPPVIYLRRPSHYLDFAMYKLGFSYKKREVSSIIPLDFPSDKILNTFKPEARTAYRRSVKSGVEVRQTDDFTSFYPILERNLALRHNVKPTHTLEEMQFLKKLFPEHVLQFGAFIGDTMVAGVTNVICNERVVLAFYISHDETYQKMRPVNHLFYEIIRWAIEEGYKFLDYGIFTVNEDPNWGLGKFKESFGARGILRETFQIEF